MGELMGDYAKERNRHLMTGKLFNYASQSITHLLISPNTRRCTKHGIDKAQRTAGASISVITACIQFVSGKQIEAYRTDLYAS